MDNKFNIVQSAEHVEYREDWDSYSPIRATPAPRDFFRAIKLQSLIQLTPWARNGEQKKVAIYKSRYMALFHLIPLFPSLAIALLLLVWNIKGYFAPSGLADCSSASLQFLAKVLEVIMQASLGTMLMGYVRWCMTSTEGVPLGGIAAPLSITGISYLWSLEFWGAATILHRANRRQIGLVLLIVVTFILSVLVGPSGAVLLIPRQIRPTKAYYQLFTTPQSKLFPKEINFETTRTFNWTSFVRQISQIPQPAYTMYDDPFDQTIFLNELDVKAGIGAHREGHYGSYLDFPKTEAPQFYATFPNLMVASSVGSAAADLITRPPKSEFFIDRLEDVGFIAPSKQPVVRQNPDLGGLAFVNAATLSDSSNVSSLLVKGPKAETPEVFPFASILSALNISSWRANQTYTGFVDTRLHSLLCFAAYAITGNEYGEIDPNGVVPFWAIYAMPLDVVWMETPLNINGSTVLVSGPELVDVIQEGKADPPLQTVVPVSTEWANTMLNLLPDEVPLGSEAIFNSRTWSPYMHGRIMTPLAIALSNIGADPISDSRNTEGYLTNQIRNQTADRTNFTAWAVSGGLSYEQSAALLQYADSWDGIDAYDSTFFFAIANDTSQPRQLSRILIDRFQRGIGYGTTDISVKLSITVIAVYCALITAYICVTLASGITGTSWDSISELVLLALKSEPPREGADLLKNTTVGAETFTTYRREVNVSVNKAGAVELCVKRRTNTLPLDDERIRYNEKY